MTNPDHSHTDSRFGIPVAGATGGRQTSVKMCTDALSLLMTKKTFQKRSILAGSKINEYFAK